jgi:hypothetical protein
MQRLTEDSDYCIGQVFKKMSDIRLKQELLSIVDGEKLTAVESTYRDGIYYIAGTSNNTMDITETDVIRRMLGTSTGRLRMKMQEKLEVSKKLTLSFNQGRSNFKNIVSDISLELANIVDKFTKNYNVSETWAYFLLQ